MQTQARGLGDTVLPWLLAGLLSLSLVPGDAAAPETTPAREDRATSALRGFTNLSSKAERRVEAALAASLDAARIDRDLRELTREPHTAGTERNNALAHLVAQAFREAGLSEVTETAYDVLMSYPREVLVEMVGPVHRVATIAEDVIESDPDTRNPNLGLPYHGFSASGEVTAEVVYARNGNPEDYAYLRSRSIDVRGKLVLVRPSVPYSYRGFKAYTAQKLGVAGLLIYSDPKDDGFAKGKVYPDGPWGSEGHIQRGAITFDFLVPGDPLTPGWPSLDGRRRIPVGKAASVPAIMSQPITAHDARAILAALGGEEAPEEWRGALPVTYRLGPGPAKVHLKLDVPRPVTKIIDVTGRIRGREEPERIVLLGNHRDAWVFGGHDPSSGTATMLELARALGGLAGSGWRPRRTIVIANWDAEEFALTGSTEWGEEHVRDLRKNLVAYLNVDSAAAGREFSVSASAPLAPLIEDAIRDTVDPATGGSVYDEWKKGAAVAGTIAVAGGSGKVEAIGSGSDHTVFLDLIGAPSLDMTFEGDYGVYHSAYDDYGWMTRYGDPGMRYSRAMAEIWGRMALRLADAEILPLDYGVYGREIGGYLDDLKLDVVARGARANTSEPGRSAELASTAGSGVVAKELAALRRSITGLATAGAKLGRLQNDPTRLAALPPAERARVNDSIIRAERDLCDPAGLPDRPWFKHLVYACRYTYLPLTLPGLTEAVERKDDPAIGKRSRILSRALDRAARRLGEPLPPGLGEGPALGEPPARGRGE